MRQSIATRDLRAIQLDILDRFNDLCARHQLRYFLCAGTLLGAVRHSGYIPWDDDIDVMMPRPDYDRLCELLARATPDGLRFYSTRNTPNYGYPYAKLGDVRTLFVERFRTTSELAVHVDIFPLDGWPTSRALQKLHSGRIRLLRALLLVAGAGDREDRRFSKAVVLRLLSPFTRLLDVNVIANWIERAATQFAFNRSQSAGVVVWGYQEIVDRRAYEPGGEAEFEGRSLPVPRNYDLVLRTLFGEYERLPPVHARVSQHNFEAFWRD